MKYFLTTLLFLALFAPQFVQAEQTYYVECTLKRSVGKCLGGKDTTVWTTKAASSSDAIAKGNIKGQSPNASWDKCKKASTDRSQVKSCKP